MSPFRCGWMLLGLPLAGGLCEAACPVVFSTPSDDRWHYPFNFTPGFRGTASCFGSTADPAFDTFNDRDGIFLLGWRTDDQIEPGLLITNYEILSVEVVLTAAAGTGGVGSFPPADWFVDLTPDPWFNMDYPLTDNDAGSPLELYGMGFGPSFSEASWDEGSQYIGGDDFAYSPRDPYPFVFSAMGPMHVEDNVKAQFTPIPWAIGVPQEYIRPASVPFAVHFDVDLDLSNGLVLDHFKEKLQSGRVLVTVTSLYATVQEAPTGFPNFYTKESPDPAAVNPILIITLASSGDITEDRLQDLTDYAAAAECINGPLLPPSDDALLTGDECLCAFDFDNDNDLDLADAAVFWARFDGGF